MKHVPAVILAGGQGTRLYPVTLETPKPLLTVKRWPIINHLIDFIRRHGVKKFHILIGKTHEPDFEWWFKRYKDHLPAELEIHTEPEPLGTFGGLKMLQSKLKSTFILTNGDELKDWDLRAQYNLHKSHHNAPVATIARVKVPDPHRYGVPVMEGDIVKEFLEKPQNPPSDFINSGLYILEPEIFQYADWNKGLLMIEKDIFPRLAAEEKLVAYKRENGRWYDTGTFERWEKAIKEW